MGVYTCLKHARFAGKDYKPGDIVPAEAIPANRVDAVIRFGLISEAQQAADPEYIPAPADFGIPIKLADGAVEELEVTPETVREAVAILQMNAEEAAKHIAAVTDATALIVIDACDSRKTVKKAAAERVAAISDQAPAAQNGAAL